MRILFDTNVVIDLILQRPPWLADVQALWQAHEDGQLLADVTATTLTDIFYVVRRIGDRERAHAAVQLCLDAFDIIPVDRILLERAQQASGLDFEDNLQIACAEAAGLDAIVTRDTENFRAARLPVWSPAECRQRLAELDSGLH